MADASKYTIEERLIVRVWVHEKERTGETYKEIGENFFLRFNKAAPSEAKLPKFSQADRHGGAFKSAQKMMVHMPKR